MGISAGKKHVSKRFFRESHSYEAENFFLLFSISSFRIPFDLFYRTTSFSFLQINQIRFSFPAIYYRHRAKTRTNCFQSDKYISEIFLFISLILSHVLNNFARKREREKKSFLCLVFCLRSAIGFFCSLRRLNWLMSIWWRQKENRIGMENEIKINFSYSISSVEREQQERENT